MRIEELKQKIGNRAKDIIIADLGLKQRGGVYTCCVTNHKKGDAYASKWYEEKMFFKCHDCGELYDICDHAATKGDKMRYLHELAGVEFRERQFKKIEPICKTQGAAGVDYLVGRGVSRDTLKKYKVTTDAKWIYFNFILPDGKTVCKIKKRAIGDMANGAQKNQCVPGGDEILFGLHLMAGKKILAICEGEIDAMSLYECAIAAGKQDVILPVSLSSGAGSMACIENCKSFIDQFEMVIIIPDNDEAGQKFVNSAKSALEDYRLFVVQLPDMIKDVNDYLRSPDHNPADIFKRAKEIMPEIKGVRRGAEIRRIEPAKSIATGFLTQDYNDSGCRMGCLALYTGKTGDGKTTYTRQILISVAKQKQLAFMFCGESSVEEETDKLARLSAEEKNIEQYINIGGAVKYRSSEAALAEYHTKYGNNIILADQETMKASFPVIGRGQSSFFHVLLKEMYKMAKIGVRVFLLDNLMVLCSGAKSNIFELQREIIGELKLFVNTTSSYVALVAHPKAGIGHEKISGATELMNTADSIFRYVRVNEDNRDIIAKAIKLPDWQKQKISAVLFTEKVRDDGLKLISALTWDEKRGALYNLTTLPRAGQYQSEGYWTQNASHYSEDDRPSPYI